MSSSRDKRERHLREERERRARKKPSRAKARIQCTTCGTTIEAEGHMITGSRQDLPIPPDAQIRNLWLEVQCPTCGESVRPLNNQTLIMGDKIVTGFADTPGEMQHLTDAMDALLRVDQGASLDEIVDVLARQGESTRLIRDYIRDNRDFLLGLAGLGVSTIGVILSLVMYLFPQHPEPTQPAPGVTDEQKDWLDGEFRKREQGHEPPSTRDEDGHSGDESDVRPDREGENEQSATDEGAGGAKT